MFITLSSHLPLILLAAVAATTTTTTTTSLASPSRSLLARESNRDDVRYDPYIICEGNGPTHSEGLPQAYSPDAYVLNLYLCSTAHGVPRHNVGCSCSHSRGNVHCSENVADPTLWNAIYKSFDPEEIDDAVHRGFPDGSMPFWEYCWGNCLCVDEEEAYESGSANISEAISVLQRFRAGELGRQIVEETQSATAADSSDTGTEPGTNGLGPIQEDTLHGKNHPVAVQHQCGTNCTTDRDCKNTSLATTTTTTTAAGAATTGSGGGTPEGSTCNCRTQSSQYQPGSGAVAFVAACLIDMAKGGKRDEEWPCPCNSTYVSHSCCGEANGLVWEAEEFKLGELLV